MTEPIKDLLPRDEMPKKGSALIQFADGIDELVNFGTHLLKWDLDLPDGEQKDITAAMMFRHFIELMDSIAILVRNSSIDSCKPILRSALELFFSMEYLLEEDSTNRAIAFSYWLVNSRLSSIRKTNPADPMYQDFIGKIKKDKILSEGSPELNISDIENRIKRIEADLSSPVFAKAKIAYQAQIEKGNNHPKWYNIFSDIKNIEQLAIHLNRQAFYEIYYRNWSDSSHVSEAILMRFAVAKDDSAEIYQLRYPKEAQTITQDVFHLCLLTFELMMDKRLMNYKDDYLAWYRSIRDFYRRLTTEKMFHIDG